MSLSFRATSALGAAGLDPAKFPALAALVNLASRNPGHDPRNYFDSWRDKEGVKAYRADCRSTSNDWKRVKEGVLLAAAVGVEDRHIIEAARNGRLEHIQNEKGHGWNYIAGQNYPTEFRGACASVIEQAVMYRRRELPPTTRAVESIADLKALNEQNGGCWFSRSNMRFFGTAIESGIIGGRYFITSEQPPHSARDYTVRSFNEKGSINTVGERGAYSSRRDALRAAVDRATNDARFAADLPVLVASNLGKQYAAVSTVDGVPGVSVSSDTEEGARAALRDGDRLYRNYGEGWERV
jgi:hypothetical protein